MISGIDVSRWQDPSPSLAGLAFMVAKATEGTYHDPMYATHMSNARKAGIPFGAYAFNRNDVDIVRQATEFATVSGGADFWAIDVEGTYMFTPAQTTLFINTFRKLTGNKIGLYISASPFPKYKACGQDWNWIASWSSLPPDLPYAFWQDGPITINSRKIDHDYFDGTMEQLRTFIGAQGGSMQLDSIVYQFWTANGTSGALRALPNRTLAPSAVLPAGTSIISIGEYKDAVSGNNWRLAEWPVGSRTLVWFLRAGPNLAADHDFVAGNYVSFETTTCEAKIAAAVAGQKVADNALLVAAQAAATAAAQATAGAVLAAKQAQYDLDAKNISVEVPSSSKLANPRP